MKRLLKTIFIIAISITTQFAMLEAGQAPAGSLSGASAQGLTLKGTLFTQSLSPLAIIEDARSGQIVMYELGDDVDGLKIVRIKRGEIILNSSDGEFTLTLPGGGISQPVTDMINDEKWYNVIKQGNVITTDRETISGAISRVRDIMRDVKIGPYSADGKKLGIAITRLNENGILKEIGIKQGDVIETVNDLTLNSPYQIFNAYRKLKGKDQLEVKILRSSQPLILTYRVQ